METFIGVFIVLFVLPVVLFAMAWNKFVKQAQATTQAIDNAPHFEGEIISIKVPHSSRAHSNRRSTIHRDIELRVRYTNGEGDTFDYLYFLSRGTPSIHPIIMNAEGTTVLSKKEINRAKTNAGLLGLYKDKLKEEGVSPDDMKQLLADANLQMANGWKNGMDEEGFTVLTVPIKVDVYETTIDNSNNGVFVKFRPDEEEQYFPRPFEAVAEL